MQASYPETFPGFGLPLNHNSTPNRGDSELIPTGLTRGGWIYPMITVHERRMLQVMNDITDKKDWFVQINDDEVVEQWKKEIQAEKSNVKLTPKMLDWCFDELLDASQKIDDLQHPPPTFALNGDVYKSDSALSESFRQSLQNATESFAKRVQAPSAQLRNLVDPSMFPLVYGRSRVLTGSTVVNLNDCISRCGEGVIVPLPDPSETKDPDAITSDSWETLKTKPEYSPQYQWLPCEVDIRGERARITSYINNLHPREKDLYALVEDIVEASILMWGLALSPIYPQNVGRKLLGSFQRITPESLSYEIDMAEFYMLDYGPQPEVGEKDDSSNKRWSIWQQDASVVDVPEPDTDFADLDEEIFSPPFDLRERFGHQGLQVIVKMTDIHLTPSQPSYDGSLWQVQGHLNEHIIATSVYFYSNENVTLPHISFQHNVGTSEDDLNAAVDLSGTSWIKQLFDCTLHGPGIQLTGGVAAHQGRIISFPNTIQERIEPFLLQDPTQAGHCKMVVFFLVEPTLKILSTAKVPCQRKDWWEEAAQQEKGMETHPEFVDFPLDMEEGIKLLQEFEEEQNERDEQQREYFARECFDLDYWV